MKKRSIAIVIVIIISTIMLANSAWAGSAQRNRWKGVAIGIGAAVLGSAIYNHHKNSSSWKDDSRKSYKHRRHYHPPEYHWDYGHWEIHKEWVPPTYKQVWNPGHYDPHGRWVEGHWMDIVDKPGYWTEKRVWVAGRSRHR